jgi:hypothetical protein
MDSIEGILDGKGRTIYSVRPEVMALEAAEAMCSAHIGALLVLDE